MGTVTAFHQPICSYCSTKRTDLELNHINHNGSGRERYAKSTCKDELDCQTQHNLKILSAFYKRERAAQY